MDTQVIRERPDTHEMVVIHRIFRQGFATLAEAAHAVSPGDSARATAVARHAEFMLHGLHHHHTAEDTYLWPRLVQRAHTDAALVQRMSEQHEAVAQHVQNVYALLPAWRTAHGGRELGDSLRSLNAALEPHLDEEERAILPLVREYISVAEWQEAGDAAFAGFTNDEKLLALGQMLEVSTPEEAATFWHKLPLPVRLIWHLAGRRRYRRHIHLVTGKVQ